MESAEPLIAAIAGFDLGAMLDALNPQRFGAWIEQYPAWAPLISIAFAIFVSLTPLPMETIAIMNGMWFGPRVGGVLTWVGALIAAMLAFCIAKVLGYPVVRRMMPKGLFRRMEEVVERHGPPMLIMVRMIPLIPFTVINYGAGVTTVKWRTFLWTSAVGFILPTILWVSVGDMMRERPALGILVLTVLAVATFFLARRFSSWWARSHGEASD